MKRTLEKSEPNLISMFSPNKMNDSEIARKKAKFQKTIELKEMKTAAITSSKIKSDKVCLNANLDDLSNFQLLTKACKFIYKFGIVFLTNNQNSFIPEDLLIAMNKKSIEIEKKITKRLNELKIPFSNDHLNKHHLSRAEKSKFIEEIENTSNFKFLEVSSRCFGRLDIKFGMDKYPFNDIR